MNLSAVLSCLRGILEIATDYGLARSISDTLHDRSPLITFSTVSDPALYLSIHSLGCDFAFEKFETFPRQVVEELHRIVEILVSLWPRPIPLHHNRLLSRSLPALLHFIERHGISTLEYRLGRCRQDWKVHIGKDWRYAYIPTPCLLGPTDSIPVARTQAEINAASRSGGIVGTEKKYAAGSNAAHKDTEGQRLAKIDRENDVAAPKKLDADVGKVMAKARTDKGMKQADLAQKMYGPLSHAQTHEQYLVLLRWLTLSSNEKPSVVNDYEQARAIPSQQVLGKIERALGVKLRGKDIGEPLGGPKKA